MYDNEYYNNNNSLSIISKKPNTVVMYTTILTRERSLHCIYKWYNLISKIFFFCVWGKHTHKCVN